MDADYYCKKQKMELQLNQSQIDQTMSRANYHDLCDDLVSSEIISRLPLKYAIQCKTLNKNFNAYISHSTFKHKHPVFNNTILFHTSTFAPIFFSKILPSHETTIDPLPLQVNVLASLHGLLFLSINSEKFVFNPITGQALAIGNRKAFDGDKKGPTGLVVDLVDESTTADCHPFKLVTIEKMRNEFKIRFKVIVPSGSSARIESRAVFACDTTFTWMDEIGIVPVYVNGALYWLGDDVSKILAYNVEKRRAKIINGPIRVTSFDHNMWFGRVKDVLSFVDTLNQITSIHAYVNDEWQLRHRMTSSVSNPWNSTFHDYKYETPVFFDGEKVFFQCWRKGEDTGEVSVHEIKSGKRECKGRMPGWFDANQLFVAFLPTLAKVYGSDDDHNGHLLQRYKGLKIKHSNYNPDVYECLLRLQRFLTGHST